VSEIRNQLDKELDVLRRIRDELKLQLHLGGSELQEGFEELEKGWQHLEGRLKVLGRESEDIAEGLGDTLSVLAGQLGDGYRRLKKHV
jgi:SMC interacting uncharacterized protein involved in chromosome segregation